MQAGYELAAPCYVPAQAFAERETKQWLAVHLVPLHPSREMAALAMLQQMVGENNAGKPQTCPRGIHLGAADLPAVPDRETSLQPRLDVCKQTGPTLKQLCRMVVITVLEPRARLTTPCCLQAIRAYEQS